MNGQRENSVYNQDQKRSGHLGNGIKMWKQKCLLMFINRQFGRVYARHGLFCTVKGKYTFFLPV